MKKLEIPVLLVKKSKAQLQHQAPLPGVIFTKGVARKRVEIALRLSPQKKYPKGFTNLTVGRYHGQRRMLVPARAPRSPRDRTLFPPGKAKKKEEGGSAAIVSIMAIDRRVQRIHIASQRVHGKLKIDTRTSTESPPNNRQALPHTASIFNRQGSRRQGCMYVAPLFLSRGGDITPPFALTRCRIARTAQPPDEWYRQGSLTYALCKLSRLQERVRFACLRSVTFG